MGQGDEKHLAIEDVKLIDGLQHIYGKISQTFFYRSQKKT
jgi:hypothetical protein